MKLRHTLVSIPSAGAWLDGRLSHAPDVRGLVIVVFASARSQIHPPESRLANALQRAGFATLAMDLITHYEQERDPDACFNIPQMTRRLLAVVDWIDHQPALQPLPVGLIGAATGSAVAIRAAWKSPDSFGSIVCVGGRPDLAGAAPLRGLRVPIRFLIKHDDPDQSIAAQAYALITAERDWQVIDDETTPRAANAEDPSEGPNRREERGDPEREVDACALRAIDWISARLQKVHSNGMADEDVAGERTPQSSAFKGPAPPSTPISPNSPSSSAPPEH